MNLPSAPYQTIKVGEIILNLRPQALIHESRLSRAARIISNFSGMRLQIGDLIDVRVHSARRPFRISSLQRSNYAYCFDLFKGI